MPPVIQKPAAPKVLTPYSMTEYKAKLRAYDAKRIQTGVSAALIQKENSFFPSARKMDITGSRTVPAAVRRLMARV